MEFERFRQIIAYSRAHREDVYEQVKDFYEQVSMDYGRDVLNVMQVVRPLLEEKRYLVMEIPFKDQEIGAVCYKGDFWGYTFLNSSLSKVNANFALCHEIYHIFYQSQSMKHKVELYMNSHYFEHEEELAANLFAGILLMPEKSFRSMFRKFSCEISKGETSVSLIVKLMNYFEVPYMAALLRCYELELLEDGETLKELLCADGEMIRQEFSRLWLNEDILNATGKDEYKRLELLVEYMGVRYVREGILRNRTVARVLENMREIYKEIRG